MMMTQGDIQDHEAAEQAGVNDILIKPFNVDSLRAVMGKFIQFS